MTEGAKRDVRLPLFQASYLLFFLFFAILVVGTYRECLSRTFGFSDDFWLLWKWRQDPSNVTKVWNAAGRWSTSLFCLLAWDSAQTIEDLWRPRFAALVGIYGLACCLFCSFR